MLGAFIQIIYRDGYNTLNCSLTTRHFTVETMRWNCSPKMTLFRGVGGVPEICFFFEIILFL